jgi:hypothetical protein
MEFTGIIKFRCLGKFLCDLNKAQPKPSKLESIMRDLTVMEIDEVSGAGAADLIIGAGLTRAAAGADAAIGAGIAEGLGAGAFLGPLGALAGAMGGAALAYYAFRNTSRDKD